MHGIDNVEFERFGKLDEASKREEALTALRKLSLTDQCKLMAYLATKERLLETQFFTKWANETCKKVGF